MNPLRKIFTRNDVAVTVLVYVPKVTATTFDDVRACLQDAILSIDNVEKTAVDKLVKEITDAPSSS